MNDVSNLPDPNRRNGLTYPFAEVPTLGEFVEVAPGLRWLRMNLPMSLDHINVWMLDDGDGWAIVDTGLSSEDTREAWQSVFDNHLDGRRITRVICTHLHPDHIGLAGWLCRKWNIDLWMSRTEYLLGRNLVEDTGRPAPEAGVRFYRAAGFSERSLDTYKQRFGMFGSVVSPMPDAFHRLQDGQVITIGDHEWQIVVGRGHSPEHACLYCPELNVLISGDQVLPRISSNVSLFPTEPYADPLTDWIESCARLRELLPDELLVLPAHNEPFYGLHTRLTQLIDHHEVALDRLEILLEEPKRSVDCFSALFKRKIDGPRNQMATGEALAHLACLIARGRVVKACDADGVDWYRRI